MTDRKVQGGGFCERHGPFDPPRTECPYCQLEQQHRYGPPPQRGQTRPLAEPGRPADAPPVNGGPGGGPEGAPDADAPRAGQPTSAAPLPPALAEDAADDAPLLDVPPPPLAWLIVREPVTQRGTVLPVAAGQVIGREGDVAWADARLSRRHARLTLEPPPDQPDAAPLFHLWPFAPTNPVIVNGRAIRGATPLTENDEIRLGDTLFVFKTLVD